MKPVLVVLLIIQCAFLLFILTSVPKENGRLRTALSSLRTPSQSNIAPINQNDARELRLILEQQISNRKSFTIACAVFSFVSVALMVTMLLPFGVKRSEEVTEVDGRLSL